MNIPQSIINMVADSEKRESTENVILLAMSTLSKNIVENHFFFMNNDDKWDYYCKSQLGPETKMIMSLLDSQGEKVNRIVILATKETIDIDDIHNVSAVDFYKSEISAYVKEAIQNEHQLSNGELYAMGVNFEVIELGKDDSLVNAVDAIKGNNGKKIDLYIDVQGGVRASTTQINAIVELLSSQGVTIKGRYANNYKYGSLEHEIKSVDDEYATYELVTAMEIFRKYGRGEQLRTYFDAEKNGFSKQLLTAIDFASDAIGLCDVVRFDEAIDKIATLDELYREDSVTATLKIIYQDIREDYATIINAKDRAVEQIRWCKNKGFYQQALTILESKMPQVLSQRGIIYHARNSEGVINDIIDNDKKAAFKKDIPNYVLDNYLRVKRKSGYKFIDNSDTYNPINSRDCVIEVFTNVNSDNIFELRKLLELHWKIKGFRNGINHAAGDSNRPTKADVLNSINKYLELLDELIVTLGDNDEFILESEKTRFNGDR